MFREITIARIKPEIKGHMYLPDTPKAWILFAHGSGSSRFSKRNNWVAKQLYEQGFATLLFDLLSPEEEDSYINRFNIPLLTDRLLRATNWLLKSEFYHGEKIGYFGASTGAAAALMASAQGDGAAPIYAVVSRGGRPDLAGELTLSRVEVPTLLIVGSHDEEVIKLNEWARDEILDSKLVLVPGATHLFEEAGALEEVARLSADWFLIQLEKWHPGKTLRGSYISQQLPREE